MSPAFSVTGQEADDRPNYNEVVGSAALADAFKAGEGKDGFVRGGFSINGVEYRNFEANSPDSVASQINARQADHGVYAEVTEGGQLKLSHQSDAPILIEQGPGYQPSGKPGEPPPPALENKVLASLGLTETTEENEARRAQMMIGNGAVPQVGDGRVATPIYRPDPERTSRFQTAEEIEAQNRKLMSNSNPSWAGRAPHAPHESVPGTTTTGNRPQVEPIDSNAERVRVPPGHETALGGQPLRDGASSAGAAPQTPEEREAAKKAAEDQRNAFLKEQSEREHKMKEAREAQERDEARRAEQAKAKQEEEEAARKKALLESGGT